MKKRHIAIVLLATIALTGCGQSHLGNPKLAVSLPTDCDQLARQSPAPQPDGKLDAGDAAAIYAAWGQKNAERLSRYRACQERVRARFATGQ